MEEGDCMCWRNPLDAILCRSHLVSLGNFEIDFLSQHCCPRYRHDHGYHVRHWYYILRCQEEIQAPTGSSARGGEILSQMSADFYSETARCCYQVGLLYPPSYSFRRHANVVRWSKFETRHHTLQRFG